MGRASVNSLAFDEVYAENQTKSNQTFNKNFGMGNMMDHISGIDQPIMSEQDLEDVLMMN
jgi:hypothetical protein